MAVIGVRCGNLPELDNWFAAGTQNMRDAALEVYELAVRMRGDLVVAAYDILEGVVDTNAD